MRARKATASDSEAIDQLIGRYAEQGLLLPRTRAEIRGNIDNFLVLQEKGKLISCVALESYDADLGEIRSLAAHGKLTGVILTILPIGIAIFDIESAATAGATVAPNTSAAPSAANFGTILMEETSGSSAEEKRFQLPGRTAFRLT